MNSPMLHPLEQKIVALRRRVRRMMTIYGLSLVITAMLSALVATFNAFKFRSVLLAPTGRAAKVLSVLVMAMPAKGVLPGA